MVQAVVYHTMFLKFLQHCTIVGLPMEVNITAVANNMPGEEGNGINPCNALTPSQTIDNSSYLTARLVVDSPVFTYKLDGGNAMLLPGNDTLEIVLTNGSHL